MISAGLAGKRSRPAAAVGAAVIVLITVALYWPARQAGFVGDDFMILHRLRGLSGLTGAFRFFRGEFFEYYRPLGFLSHALDWTIAGGADARQFHSTNLLLHAVNTVFVLLTARALTLRTPEASGAQAVMAGSVAALLFALHASNHEAVVWVSARFDLLATCWSLAAMWWMVAGLPGSRWIPALLFLPAVLSKESSVALPVAAAAWAVFCLGSTTRDAVRRVAPWLIVLGAYALLRRVAGGVPAAGGVARAPKLFMFATAIIVVVGCADGRWRSARSWLLAHARAAAIIVAVVLVVLTTTSMMSAGTVSALAREKLAVTGFAIAYLFAPLADVGPGAGYLQPLDAMYWRVALIGLPVIVLIVWGRGRPLLDMADAWFLAALLLAALLPVSALTEGRRYLYLPSAVIAIAIGIGAARLTGFFRALALAVISGFLAISSVQIHHKIQDWIWAGNMTAEGARLVDEALAPACNAGHVVFLTSPVGVRGVYSHFYYETFELPRGCIPETFQVVARLVRVDALVRVERKGPAQIVLTVPEYRGNLVLSEDLRQFDLPLNQVRERVVVTPLGEVRAEPVGSDQRLMLTLSPQALQQTILFFYFSEGRIHRLR